jgi:putative membrane protein
MKKISWTTVLAMTTLLSLSAAFADDQVPKLLSDLHHTNQMEIHMGAMAKEKSQSADVKAYGDKLVKDHTDADDQVLALAKKEGVALETPSQEGMMAQHDASKHMKGMADLSAKTGADFDKSFAQMMVDGHKKNIAKLQKADGSLTDPDAKALVEKLLPTLQEHLAIAQKIYGNS